MWRGMAYKDLNFIDWYLGLGMEGMRVYCIRIAGKQPRFLVIESELEYTDL
jgi:hypothetical protein